MVCRRQSDTPCSTVGVVGRVFVWHEDMIADPDGLEGEFLGGVCQAHERLGGINIAQIGQANAKLHTVSYVMTLKWCERSRGNHRGPGGAEEEVCGQDGILAGENNIIFWDGFMLGEVQQVCECLVWSSHNRVPSILCSRLV